MRKKLTLVLPKTIHGNSEPFVTVTNCDQFGGFYVKSIRPTFTRAPTRKRSAIIDISEESLEFTDSGKGHDDYLLRCYKEIIP
jgi:hypothetical protein